MTNQEQRENARKNNNTYYSRNKEKRREAARLYRSRLSPERKEENKRYFQAWRNKNKDYKRVNNLMLNYGLPEEDWDQMYNAQSGKCKICGTHQSDLKKRLHVDHCHQTGKIRGLLCSHCNHGIGYFKDNIQNCLNAAAYLSGSRS